MKILIGALLMFLSALDPLGLSNKNLLPLTEDQVNFLVIPYQ